MTTDSGAGRNGNTPPKTYKTVSVCIDYLKIRVSGNYDKERLKFRKLFDILRVIDYEIDKSFGRYGYESMLSLFPGATLLSGGSHTKTRKGEDTSLLEMSGKGCREFEDRYFSFHPDRGILTREYILREGWIKLIEECNSLSGVATRIDIPIDDMNGIFEIDDIKEKIKNHEYSTRMRKLEKTDSNDEEITTNKEEHLQGCKTIRDAKQTGYSATFGNRDKLQLCIYDKAAEQHNKGNFSNIDKWIRFESRFYHKNAENLLPLMLQALKDNRFNLFAVARLKGIFEFKEKITIKDKYKNTIWSKWDEFTQGVEKESGFSVIPGVPTIVTNAIWLKKDAAPSLGKIVCCSDAPLAETLAAYCMDFLHRVDNSHLQAINQWRRQNNKKPFENIKDLKNFIFSKTDFPEEIHEDTMKLIIQIGNEKKDEDG